MKLPSFLEREIDFPFFYPIEINFPRPKLTDFKLEIQTLLNNQLKLYSITKGDSVAIGVGSRGIAMHKKIIHLIVTHLKECEITPTIIPAMGSHAGATAEGQIENLKLQGISEETMGCSILSSLEVTQLDQILGEVPVYFSKDALKFDHTICVNRIKPHTKFKGKVESGIIKMLCIGLGKHKGAVVFHHWALKYGFSNLLKKLGEAIIPKSNFRFGIGIIENAFDETMNIEALPAETLFQEESHLLNLAKKNMPFLPVAKADVLIINQIGKNISGAGMDPNITGRAGDLNEDDFSKNFQATRLAALNLSEESQGNGLGIGNADVITEKLLQALHYENTMLNALTGLSLHKVKIPIAMASDKKAIQLCFQSIRPIEPKNVEAIVIKDTLTISPCFISEALLGQIQMNPKITICDKIKLPFDIEGNLTLF